MDAQAARQVLGLRRSGEESEGCGCGFSAPREVREDCVDHRGILDARHHLDRTPSVLAGQDDHLETRFNRWTHAIERWRAGHPDPEATTVTSSASAFVLLPARVISPGAGASLVESPGLEGGFPRPQALGIFADNMRRI